MRGVLKFVLTLLVVLVLAWIGLWWYAQSRLQSGFQAWATDQASHGINVAYTSLQRGTNPTEALLTITGLTITGPQVDTGVQPVITLPTLAFRIEAASPTIVHIDLPPKITVSVGANEDVAMNSGSIALAEYIDPSAMFDKSVYPFRGGDFSASNIDFLASSGSLLVLHMDSMTGHADINLNAAGGQQALYETLSLNGLALSPLMTKLASIPFDGKVNQLGFTLTLSGPIPPTIFSIEDQLRAAGDDQVAEQKLIVPLVHQWASQGGSGSFGLSLAIGPSTANADAAVKFDANIQPEGTANLTADHLDQFAAAITAAYPQIADTITQAQAQLTPYITTSPTTGQTLALHLTYGASTGVSVNGTKLTDQPPIDWTSLENPPPASPTPGQ